VPDLRAALLRERRIYAAVQQQLKMRSQEEVADKEETKRQHAVRSAFSCDGCICFTFSLIKSFV
jgi:hypothetical protein